MIKNFLHRYPLWARYVSGVLAIIFVISLIIFVDALSDVRHGDKNPQKNIPRGVSGEMGGFLTVDDIDTIEGWMSFEYVNFAFGLPPRLLEEKLSIQDNKYPRIPLKKYAKEQNTELSKVLDDVHTIVSEYLTSSEK